MVRFTLGRIPVEVHFSHLLVSVLFALALKPIHASPAWPNRVLVDPAQAGYSKALGIYVAGWILVFFISVLVHELGHAVLSRTFGYRPLIRLMWLGGHTEPNAPGPIPWHRDVVLTLAGPFFGLSLAVAGIGLQRWLGSASEVATYFLKLMTTLNFGWTLLNLLPMPPLDGGRVSTSILMRLFGRVGFLVAQLLALTVAAAIIALAFLYDAGDKLFLALFFGTFALRAGAAISTYFRGEESGPIHPHEALFAEALARVQTQRLDEAKALLERLLTVDTSPSLRGRVHHLRGWVAIKEGLGREALDHFSQVQRDRIEPQAVAAAFSLLGDDARAIPMWEAAYRETPDPTILHEWAGALIREGEIDRALRLEGVDSALAFQCAQEVLTGRQRFEEAARLGQAGLLRFPHPRLAYDTACAWAHAGRRDDALNGLRQAQALGSPDVASARTDPDLVSLHGWPPFEEWLAMTPR